MTRILLLSPSTKPKETLYPTEKIERRLVDCTGACNAGVVHQHIDAPVLGDHLIKGIGDRGIVIDIEGKCRHR